MQTRVFLFLCLLPVLSWGHDLWIEREGTLHTLVYGHAHERSEHEGAKKLDYKPEVVQQAACYDTSGRRVNAQWVKGYPTTLQGDCAASWFFTSSGYWSKTPYDSKNLPKHKVDRVIDSWFSAQGVKRIDRWDTGLAQPLTHELELVPLDNPLLHKPGDKLQLRAWYQDKPAAGVTVAYFGKPRGVTDADGNIDIRLRNPGFQLIQASIELPRSDGKADKTVYASTLQFDLP